MSEVVSIHPYFKANEGKLNSLLALLPEFVAKTKAEECCLYYDFTINGDVIHCREAYHGGEAALHHLSNVGDLLDRLLKISELIRLEIHGTEAEIAKLKPHLAELNPDYFIYVCGT